MVVVFLHWELIPERFAIRWNFNGEEVAWREKSVLGMLMNGLIGLSILTFLHLCFSPQYRDRGGLKKFPLGFSVTFMYGVAVVLSLSALFPVLHIYWSEGSIIPVIIAAIAISFGLILLAISAFSDENKKENIQDADISVFDDPKYWKSFFYNNPDDSVLFIEKQIGSGYTLNIGQPRAKWVLAFSIVYFAIIITLTSTSRLVS